MEGSYSACSFPCRLRVEKRHPTQAAKCTSVRCEKDLVKSLIFQEVWIYASKDEIWPKDLGVAAL